MMSPAAKPDVGHPQTVEERLDALEAQFEKVLTNQDAQFAHSKTMTTAVQTLTNAMDAHGRSSQGNDEKLRALMGTMGHVAQLENQVQDMGSTLKELIRTLDAHMTSLMKWGMGLQKIVIGIVGVLVLLLVVKEFKESGQSFRLRAPGTEVNISAPENVVLPGERP